MLPYPAPVSANNSIVIQYVPIVVRPETRDAGTETLEQENKVCNTSCQTLPEVPEAFSTLLMIGEHVRAINFSRHISVLNLFVLG